MICYCLSLTVPRLTQFLIQQIVYPFVLLFMFSIFLHRSLNLLRLYLVPEVYQLIHLLLLTCIAVYYDCVIIIVSTLHDSASVFLPSDLLCTFSDIEIFAYLQELV